MRKVSQLPQNEKTSKNFKKRPPFYSENQKLGGTFAI
jgi:hypothetical protein